MQYKKADLEKKALAAIKEHSCIDVVELTAYLPCCNKTFYNHGLHELQSIKDAVEQQKVNIKAHLRKKWYDSDNATTGIALYKLSCTDEERKKLSTNYNENDNKHTGDFTITLDLGNHVNQIENE